MKPPRNLQRNLPLARLTTLEVGGPAAAIATCATQEELLDALAWARQQGLETFILGGGSNLLVSDEGFDGLVIRLADDHLDFTAEGPAQLVKAGAALPWDRLVAATTERGLAGLEALSGIPGQVGAAPIQNIGAYGQELADTLHQVEAFDPAIGEATSFSAADCRFAYRHSLFKESSHRHLIVTRITLRLHPGVGTLAYGELRRRLEAENGGADPTPAQVRDLVLEVRRAKSMVLYPQDPNRRSAGSFFVNPVLPVVAAESVRERVASLRGPEAAQEMPWYPGSPASIKLSAAWLIEAAGFHRGYRLEGAGLSTNHSLALINVGGGTARDLLQLAGRIRRRVRDAFGVTLNPEPVFLGFSQSSDQLLG